MTGIHERVGVLTRPVDLTGHPRSLMRVAPRAPPAPCGRGAAPGGGEFGRFPMFGVGSDSRQADGRARPSVPFICCGPIVYGRAGGQAARSTVSGGVGWIFLFGRPGQGRVR